MAREQGSRKNNPEARMALAEHLRELRRRVIFATAGILIGGIVGWILYNPNTIGPIGLPGGSTLGPIEIVGVFEALQRPIEELQAVRPELVTLNFQGIGTAFDMQLRIALFTGLLLSSPWWIYQILAFITPGLTKNERKYTFGFMGVAVPLFATGAILAWSVLPKALEVLIGSFTPDNTTNLLAADIYLKFVMQFVLAFGIAFLLPLVMVALNFMGVVKAGLWLKGWRWAIVGIFTFCAFATPNPEPTAMIFMALPIVALYFIAVYVCHVHDKRAAKRRAQEDAELAAADDASTANA
ncbi:twin-arginine translocase subunit TatC [Pseudactinotalea suaedae]|uniref:twin-arginine translocase subunit TatC n=1 Tax=Pseudactinotalea suaedae TaxID=1524924 RepID=UPI001F4F2B44|nr:twin-arginine translocase subunit TatC [Pseudactinotalea suaedae]